MMIKQVVNSNSSLATTVGPGGEISLVTLRDLLAERSGDHQERPLS